jgi:hypothetical protein
MVYNSIKWYMKLYWILLDEIKQNQMIFLGVKEIEHD